MNSSLEESATAAVIPLPERPYPGLRPFRLKDSPLFFGRSRERIQVLELLEDSPFLAVLGSSGSGKSSLVLSGLLPDIASGKLLLPRPTEFAFTDFRPGSNPYAALAEALGKGPLAEAFADPLFIEEILRSSPLGLAQVLEKAWSGTAASEKERALVVVVDQFEEFFRFAGLTDRSKDRAAAAVAAAQERDFHLVAGNMNEAQAFVDLLLAATKTSGPRIFIVLTMRSDFYKHCEAFDGLPRMIAAHQYLAPRMDRRQLEDAIRLPLRAFGWEIEDKLVNWMLNDVQGEYDQLPILQHALFRMWGVAAKDPARRTISAADYEAIGKLEGALNDHGSELIGNRDGDALGRLFRCLGDFDPVSGEAIRRPRLLGQLVAESSLPRESVVQVVDLFRSNDHCFLMPPPQLALQDDTPVDLTHECLLRKWTALAGWMKAERGKGRELLRLKERAADVGWEGGVNRTGTHLSRLEVARFRQEVLPEHQLNPGWGGRYQADAAGLADFLEKEKEHFAEEDRNARRRKQRRNAWVGVGCLGILIFALWGWQLQVGRERSEAELKSEAQDAKIQLLESKRQSELKEQENKNLRTQLWQRDASQTLAPTLSEAGQRAAEIEGLRGAAKQLLEFSDVARIPDPLKKELRQLGVIGEALPVTLTKGDRRIHQGLLSGPYEEPVHDVAFVDNGEKPASLLIGTQGLYSLSLREDSGKDKVLGDPVWKRGSAVVSVSPFAESKGCVVATNGERDFAWRGPDGEWRFLNSGAEAVVGGQWVSARQVLFGSGDGKVGIWEPGDSSPKWIPGPQPGTAIEEIVVDGLSERFLTLDREKRATLWNWNNGEPTVVIAGGAGFEGIAKGSLFVRNEMLLLRSDSKIVTMVRFKLPTPDGRFFTSSLLHDDLVSALTLSPDGTWLATATGEFICLWRVDDAARRTTAHPAQIVRGHHSKVTALEWAPSGIGFASADDSGTVLLWRLASGERNIGGPNIVATPVPMASHRSAVRTLAWAADGSGFSTGGDDGLARIHPALLFFSGKFKTFGGPNHQGSGESALIGANLARSGAFARLFLKEVEKDGDVLKQLNPEASYVAARWDYSLTNAAYLRSTLILVRNPKTGQTESAQAVDWGPNDKTGKAVDLSPGLKERLGLRDDDDVELELPLLPATFELADPSAEGPSPSEKSPPVSGE